MIAILLALLAVVNVPNPSVSYTCDGSTAAYTVNFPYLAYTDLQVTSTTPAGIGTTLTYTTDFSVNLTSTSSTATLTLTNPGAKCPSGNVLKIARNLALTQPYGFKAQTTYNQNLHETAYDRAVMLIQQTDAKVSSTDVKAYVDAAVSATLTGGQNVQPITWNVTGDGAANVFSIANAVVNSPDLYIVTIDGVFQRPTTDYTVSTAAAQITFASVPALNAVISVRSFGYARALSVGDNTSVLATGTAVPRPLKDWFADALALKSMGVKCDNSTDDTLALQAAVNLAPAGRQLQLPTGVCLTSAPIALPANTALFGAGTTEAWNGTGVKGTVIKNTTNGNTFTITNVTAVRVEGITFFGSTSTGAHFLIDGSVGASSEINLSNNTFLGKDNAVKMVNTVFQIFLLRDIMSAQNLQGVVVDSSLGAIGAGDTSIYLREVWVRGSGAEGIKVFGAQGTVNLVIDRCQISNIGVNNMSAISINNVSGATITSNDIESITGTGTANGIWCQGSSSITMTGNTFFDVRGNASIYGSTCYRSHLGPNRILKGSSAASFAVQLDGGSLDNTITDQHTDFANQLLNSGATSFSFIHGVMTIGPTTFTNLSTPGNGSFIFCSDCTIANPCAGGGTGALAKRLNGVWVCN